MTAVFHERRAFISAPLRCVGAARREDTALRQFIEHRHIARNAEQGVFFFIKTRDGCLQSLGIGMFWLRKDLFPFGIFYQLARVHDRYPVCHLGDDAHIMADEDNGSSCFLLQAADQSQDLGLHRYVQRRGRFVTDQKPRPADQRHGDHDTLAHTAGKLGRNLRKYFFRAGDANGTDHIQGTLLRLCFAHLLMRGNGLHDLTPAGHQRV